jgi:hypothetical protein
MRSMQIPGFSCQLLAVYTIAITINHHGHLSDERISTSQPNANMLTLHHPYLWAFDRHALARVARRRVDGELQGHGGAGSTRRVPNKSNEPGDGTCSGGPC